jgi:hypothetical protein
VLSFAIGFVKVVAMNIAPKTRALLADLTGPAGDDQEAEQQVERASGQPTFGALGIVSRARAPSTTGAVEGVGLRTGDGLVPFALRDVRLNALYPNPKEASVALVGYAGAFDSNEAKFDDTGGPKSSIRTIYVPYVFDVTANKAHVITLDATDGNESISIVHGEGHSIVLTRDREIFAQISAGTWMVLRPNEFSVQADAINLIGTVAIGNPTSAVPLVPGGTQGSTRLLITTP